MDLDGITMDPNRALARIREIISHVNSGSLDRRDALPLLDELATIVESLDGWLASGGFPPADWVGESVSDIIDAAHGIEV